MKKKLVLKQHDSSREATKKIYDLTRETCENFNSYYLDFFESLAILEEKRDKAEQEGKTKKRDEIDENIGYMQGKIEELSTFMADISQKMSQFVELVDAE